MNRFAYERQWPLMAYQDLLVADFAAGAAVPALSLPGGAVVTSAFVVVKTPFNSATTATLSIGDDGLATRYGAGIDLKTTGRKPLTPTGFVTPSEGPVVATFAQTGAAATAGEARLYVEYVVERKADEIQD